jgi:purine-binding chemotaxis protein CheW
MKEFKIITFTLSGDKIFGLDTSFVREIIKYKDVEKQRKLPEFIDGTVILRRNMIPVINLNKRYGYKESQITRKSRIIIQKIKEREFGLAVDSVMEIKSFLADNIENIPHVLEKNNYNMIRRVIKTGEDNLISVIEPESILSEKEYALINECVNK